MGLRLKIGHATAALALAAAISGVRPSAADDLLSIRHEPVRCLVAGKYPELAACFDPPSRLARARVYFRADGVGDWYYVEMKAGSPCFRGVLPRPKKSLKSVSYYVAGTDVGFAEARTGEVSTRVVADDKACAGGLVAPFLTSASVIVGGAAALPAGFVGAGVLAGVSTTALVAGVAVVGGGTAGAVIAGGGGEDPPPPTTLPPGLPATTTTTTTLPSGPATTTTTTTTTLPSGPTTTTTTTTTTLPTTTTTTTTTLPTCPDSAPPEVRILSPVDTADVPAVVDIVAEASDPGPVASGVSEVRIYAEELGGTRRASIARLTGPGPTYRASWAIPSCLGPQDRWYVNVEAVDGCGRTTLAQSRVKRRSDTCVASSSSSSSSTLDGRSLTWTSELAVPGGRGQVIANGTFVLFPDPGRSELVLPARPGPNRLEALLVVGERAGTWGFTLASGEIRPGSLRVLAGEAAATGGSSVVFRLHGRPGERAVVAFDVD